MKLLGGGTQGGEGGLDSGKMRASCFPGGRSCSWWLELLLVGQLTGTNKQLGYRRASQLPLKGERQGQSQREPVERGHCAGLEVTVRGIAQANRSGAPVPAAGL